MNYENYCHICKNKSEHTLCKNCYVPLFVPIEKHLSFAFLEKSPKEVDNESLKDSIVLDYFNSSLVTAEITDFSQLRQLRLSHCKSLTNIELTNLPNLISLDAFYCRNVTKAKFSNVPNLVALDLSFCTRLKEIQGNFTKVEYFSISHTKISEIPDLPSVKFVDISSTNITDLSPLYKCQNLQRLVSIDDNRINNVKICKFAEIPTFSSLIFKCRTLDFEGCPPSHSLKNIFVSGKLLNSENVDLSEINVYMFAAGNINYTYEIKQTSLNFENPICSGDWFESYRLIYGPYPAPPNDCRQTLSEEELESIEGIYRLPSNIDADVAAYHIMGAIFGTAVGDCLGIYCEGREPIHINAFIDQPPEMTWTHPVTTERGSYFHRGSFTDDTALMLMFIRSVVSTALKNAAKKSMPNQSNGDVNNTNKSNGDVNNINKSNGDVNNINKSNGDVNNINQSNGDVNNINQSNGDVNNANQSNSDVSYFFDPADSGKKIQHWIDKGIDEHLDPKGIGRGYYTENVVHADDYEKDPIKVSKEMWIAYGKDKTGNGGVMRTGACGCFLFWDEKKVIEIAKQFCQTTHYDPRCVFSSVLISLIISRLIQWRCGLIESFELDKTIEEVKEMFLAREKEEEEEEEEEESIERISYFKDIDQFLYAQSLDELELGDDELNTLKTMGCAIWVLRKNFTYEKGIEEVVRAGYDADTNAACAGAVLGAKWGFGGIPLHILDYLWYGGILYRDTVPFLKTMGMKFDPPSYEEIQKFQY